MGFIRLARSKAALADLSDAELLRLTDEKNDHEAFGVFYRRHQRDVLAFVEGSTADRDLAQDIAAEVFAIAFSKVDRFDPARGTGRQWLFGIGRIATLARLRERGRETRAEGWRIEGDLEGDDFETVEARIDSSSSPAVTGLAALSQRERDAVVARVIEGRDYAEIAQREESTEVVVRQRVSRGLRKLARRIGGRAR